jgi:hypothetical protein
MMHAYPSFLSALHTRGTLSGTLMVVHLVVVICVASGRLGRIQRLWSAIDCLAFTCCTFVIRISAGGTTEGGSVWQRDSATFVVHCGSKPVFPTASGSMAVGYAIVRGWGRDKRERRPDRWGGGSPTWTSFRAVPLGIAVDTRPPASTHREPFRSMRCSSS